MSLDIKINERERGVFVVSPTGLIDSDTYFELENKVDSILSSHPNVIVFDMQGVNYISSAGLGVILKAKKILSENAGNLCMVNLTKNVKKVFDMINALPEQDIFATVEELDNYLAHIQRPESNS